MAIVITGSVAYDYLMTFPGHFKEQILPEKLSEISLSFLVDTMTRQRGGIAPNIAFTLALLGEKPKIMATVGQDFAEYRAWLESKGVNTEYILEIPETDTASFWANTDLDHGQIASFYTGAMADACKVSLKSVKPGDMDYVVISPNDPTAMDQYVKECLELGIPYLYDPSQQIARNDHGELRRGVEGAHALFCNEYEYELLQKHTGLDAKTIEGHAKLVVVTCAEKGAIVKSEGKTYQIPIVPATAIVDPTGVGMPSEAALRGYRLGFDLQTCGAEWGFAATYVLEQKGTQNHHYSVDEFIKRYREHFDDHGVLNALH